MLESDYSRSWIRTLEEPDPGSEMIYRVIENEIQGERRRVFSTRELQDMMRQPYSLEQLHGSLEKGDSVELIEEQMNLWLYHPGDQI